MAIVLVAGATGNLGSRIVRELGKAGASVRALVRPGGKPVASAETVEADLGDRAALDRAMGGVTTVVSALQGLEPVLIEGQRRLLRASESAGVKRFIPSDFAADFFKTEPGLNRNFDLRRRFDELLDKSSVPATSILNGAFMDLLGREGGDRMLDHKNGRFTYFGDPDQPMDFTTMDDVAAFTARAALDGDTPRVLRISGDRQTPRGVAAAAERALGRPIALKRAGGLGLLKLLIGVTKVVRPERGETMPTWQGMQYARTMFEGEALLEPLDNARYPDLRWTSIEQFLKADRA